MSTLFRHCECILRLSLCTSSQCSFHSLVHIYIEVIFYWIKNRGIIRCIGKAKMALWPRLLYLFNSILYSHNNKAFETKGNFHFKCFFVFFTVKNIFFARRSFIEKHRLVCHFLRNFMRALFRTE